MRMLPIQEALILYNLPLVPFRNPNSLSLGPKILCSAPFISRRRNPDFRDPSKFNLRNLTCRIVELTRRRQLHQVFEEVASAKRQYGELNTITMNAVMEACVHCGDVDLAIRVFLEMSRPGGCGVDYITFTTLLKGLGEARRFDEAFQMLESVEDGSAVGNLKMSPPLVYALLNTLLDAGDLRRAKGLLARYRSFLHERGPSILTYNLLIKGYTNSEKPLDALSVYDEMLREGLKPDRLTYNTLLLACVKSGEMDIAMRLFREMKGFGNTRDPCSVLRIVVEMKEMPDMFIDRVAYTAMLDALLECDATMGALCIFGEILKKSGEYLNLRPKPHVFLALMRAFAQNGDFRMVEKLHLRMLPDSVGCISPAVQVEAVELLMEAAINNGLVDLARNILGDISKKWKYISWSNRGRMVVVRLEARSRFNNFMFSPYLLPQVSLSDPIEKIMIPFKEANPLPASVNLNKVVMRFFSDDVVPIKDNWGNCVGVLHCEDCTELNAPLLSMMRGPPPCVPVSTSIGRAIDVLLEKQQKLIVIVKSTDVHEKSYSSDSKPVGVFTRKQLLRLAIPTSKVENVSSDCTVDE
ncbi:pentatricopeptide repeat-containing protein At5g10690 isoform X2 [Amborella trichopoda]|uniref:pentatricopeptide repeat-containing protein At5g10690 isoform X2 n=1 Tax=Amborella trichopoda TaxID=13333 RepID=UPI0009BCFD97|nr:pentatricopeptide repeat-containing protein At5g10690 isoform X2 [Amborella trichopoda]|eukprot:XP_020523682.1 pentatricopeptide repeat-containing protein At5g10690 isoform X2 [Amborella trichopoda]